MEPTTTTSLKLSKGDGRYYVYIDGGKVGWVLKASDGWRFYAPRFDAFQGHQLCGGAATRRDALMEGLSSLRIRHSGRIVHFNHDTLRDEVVALDEATLLAIYDRLLDEKYPMS